MVYTACPLNGTHVNGQFNVIDVDASIEEIERVRWKLGSSGPSLLTFGSNEIIAIDTFPKLKRTLFLLLSVDVTSLTHNDE